jgi:hypothetical protein
MQSRVALITFMDGGGQIDNTLPGAPTYPSQGLPPGAVQLPVFPFDPTRPDQGLPPAPGTPGTPLPPSPGHPSGQPIVPGKRFIVKWLACSGLILVPDNELPPTAEPKA